MFGAIATFSLIIIGGFLPALLWLWLILKEDRINPEPRQRLILTFMGGMAAVVVVLPIQKYLGSFGFSTPITIIIFALTEEFMKFFFANMTALHSRDADEPIDEVIYMATAALGFAALENCLFLARPILTGDFGDALLIAHIRFVGSTLVHIAASSIIGMYLAKAFYRKDKFEAIVLGLVFAVGLHSIYNFFIINTGITPIFNIFIGLWIVCIILLLVLNHIKKHLVIHYE